VRCATHDPARPGGQARDAHVRGARGHPESAGERADLPGEHDGLLDRHAQGAGLADRPERVHHPYTSETGINRVALIAAMVTGVALIALSIYHCYRFAENIAHMLGQTGTSVFLRLSSFIALCIGVQITWNGVSTLLKSLLKG